MIIVYLNVNKQEKYFLPLHYQKQKYEKMEEKPLFDIKVLEEAQIFIESVPPDARKKIYYNMARAGIV